VEGVDLVEESKKNGQRVRGTRNLPGGNVKANIKERNLRGRFFLSGAGGKNMVADWKKSTEMEGHIRPKSINSAGYVGWTPAG